MKVGIYCCQCYKNTHRSRIGAGEVALVASATLAEDLKLTPTTNIRGLKIAYKYNSKESNVYRPLHPYAHGEHKLTQIHMHTHIYKKTNIF